MKDQLKKDTDATNLPVIFLKRRDGTMQLMIQKKDEKDFVQMVKWMEQFYQTPNLQKEKNFSSLTYFIGVDPYQKSVESHYFQSDINYGTGNSSTFFQKVYTNVTGLIQRILFWPFRKSISIRIRPFQIRIGVGSFCLKIF